MPSYLFYVLDDDGHIPRGDYHICADDLDALAKAKALSDGSEIEVWQGARHVVHIKRHDEGLYEQYRQSL